VAVLRAKLATLSLSETWHESLSETWHDLSEKLSMIKLSRIDWTDFSDSEGDAAPSSRMVWHVLDEAVAAFFVSAEEIPATARPIRAAWGRFHETVSAEVYG
jgi:hypothetical protein